MSAGGVGRWRKIADGCYAVVIDTAGREVSERVYGSWWIAFAPPVEVRTFFERTDGSLTVTEFRLTGRAHQVVIRDSEGENLQRIGELLPEYTGKRDTVTMAWQARP